MPIKFGTLAPMPRHLRTGSLFAEPGSGGLQAYARNRLMQTQSWFRRTSVWDFWMLDRLHKSTLFFRHKKRGEACLRIVIARMVTYVMLCSVRIR